MTKQSLLQLLADNQMSDLFQALKNQQGYFSDLILLEGQWNDLRTKQRNGTIPDEQSNLEIARIRKSLLDLIEMTFSEHRENVGTVPPRPQTSSRQSLPKWAIPLGLVFILVVVLFSALRLADSGNKSSADISKTKIPNGSSESLSSNPKQETAAVKVLEMPENPMTLNKGRIGDITYKFLRAELSEQNPDNWLLRIKARIIKPAYGAVVRSPSLHIAYGDFEKTPVFIDFPYIGPMTTADGVAEFEIPKEYKEVKLLIYPTPGDPPGATIPIKL